MKVVFAGMVFNGDHVLEACIRSIQPFASKIVFAEGPTAYFQRQGYTTSTDRTNQILGDLIGDNVIHGQWTEKDQEAQATEALIPDDTDFVFWIDADEIWKPEDLEGIFALLETQEYDSMSFKMVSFYGGFDRIMTGFEANFEVHRIQRWFPGAHWVTHRPPTVLAPDGIPWRLHRHLGHEATEKLGWKFFHYSYVFASQMKMKMPYYREMTQNGTIEGYFDTVYRPWVLGGELERDQIETQFHGVHDWLPERRGNCYTVPFRGEHPPEIIKNLPTLKERFDAEKRAYLG